MPKESNVTLVPHNTLIRPNTLSLEGAITLFWVNTKRKTVMTLFRIVLLSNGCAVITLFKIYLKRVMTDPFTFECHYSLLDHVKLKLQSWLSFGTMFFTSVESWLSLGPLLSQSVLPLPSFRTCLSFGTREYIPKGRLLQVRGSFLVKHVTKVLNDLIIWEHMFEFIKVKNLSSVRHVIKALLREVV